MDNTTFGTFCLFQKYTPEKKAEPNSAFQMSLRSACVFVSFPKKSPFSKRQANMNPTSEHFPKWSQNESELALPAKSALEASEIGAKGVPARRPWLRISLLFCPFVDHLRRALGRGSW